MHFNISKYFLLALLCFISTANSYGQTANKSSGRIDVEITKEKKSKRIYTKVEIKRAFHGGDSSWVKSVENSLNQSLNESIRLNKRVTNGKYIVSVQFIADKDGNPFDVRCLNDPVGFGMEEEVIMAIRKCSSWHPVWGPANGRMVKPYRTSSTPRDSSRHQ